MSFNILTLTPVSEPFWFLVITLGIFLPFIILFLTVAFNDITSSYSIKGKIICASIISAIFIPLYLFLFLIPSFNKQKEYDEWCNNYHEEVLYDKIYSFDLSSSVFVVGYGRYSDYKDVSYYFYIEQENEPGTYKLTSLKFDNNVYIREVETNFNVIVFNRENSDKLEYYINVPKGTVTTTLNG